MQETETKNTLEIKIQHSNKVVGHTSCSYVNGEILLKDLYVLEKFRGQGLDEILLCKVQDYATSKNAKRITAYCGPEPFCEDGQIPLAQEVSWYEDHGFIRHHDVMGIVPCMIKELTTEGALQ